MGRRLLKFWLKRPLLNAKSIDERHDCIAFFLVTAGGLAYLIQPACASVRRTRLAGGYATVWDIEGYAELHQGR
jgi:hypothetical protein